MKISQQAREDAKKYNAMYDLFEGYDHDTHETTYYRSYGVAYRYVNAKVRKGANMSIIGSRVEFEPDYSNCHVIREELIRC